MIVMLYVIVTLALKHLEISLYFKVCYIDIIHSSSSSSSSSSYYYNSLHGVGIELVALLAPVELLWLHH